MSKKLTCTITGNWSYVDEARYDKLATKAGGEDKLIAGYMSRAGKKILAANEGDLDKSSFESDLGRFFD